MISFKYLILPLAVSLYAQDEPTIPHEVATAQVATLPPGDSGKATSDVMIVDPKVIAEDWVTAFKSLKEKKLLNITFAVQGSPPITNVAAIEPLPGGYLMLFTVKTLQGYQYQIVKTSTITSIVSK